MSLLGAGCTKGPDAAALKASQRTDLKIWSVVDDEDVYSSILTDFRLLHPFANIEYRRFRLEEYEDQLLNAFAEDRGPDIFLIHNTWIGKYLPKIQPMPLSTKVAFQTVEGTIKKETVYKLVTEPSPSLRQLKTEYPDVVVKDILRPVNISPTPEKRDIQQRAVALPISIDTLAMYVNKDLLNAAGISTIPESWDTFQTAVKKVVKQNAQGEIVQAGAALGTGSNIERAPDILSILMMQNGAEMSADDGKPIFNQLPRKLEGVRDQPPAYQALTFYTDFANPAKEVYSWNAKQANALEAFIQGKVAFFFGYSYHLPVIKARAPKLNVAIAKLPQIEGNPVVNFANYWTWAVSKKSKTTDLAWNFLTFMRKPDESKKYLEAAKRPAALRSQLVAQLDAEDVGVFASQVLTAQSWYRGDDPKAADAAFMSMIDAAIDADPEKLGQIMKNAVDRIAQTVPGE